MSEKKQPQKSEITYNSKNSYGNTYDELEKELQKEAWVLRTESEERNLPDRKEPQEHFHKIARDNARNELNEFRVEDPELARAMADAEDRERSKAAALRLFDKGILRYSGSMQRISEPGTFSLDKTSARSARSKVLDFADGASNDEIKGISLKSTLPLNAAYREISQAAAKTIYENSTSPVERVVDRVTGWIDRVPLSDSLSNVNVSVADLRGEIHPAAKRHEKRAEELGEKAAKQFLKENEYRSDKAA